MVHSHLPKQRQRPTKILIKCLGIEQCEHTIRANTKAIVLIKCLQNSLLEITFLDNTFI